MTRAFLKSLFPKDLEGLDGIVDSIMQAHGTGIESEKAKTTAVNEQTEKLKTKITDLEGKITAMGDDSEAETKLAELQAEFDKAKETHAAELKAEKDAHTATKTEYETEQTNGAMDKAVSAAMKEAGYSEAAIPLFLKAGYDRKQLKQEKDGKFAETEMTKFIETLKADPVHKTFFGEMQTEGAHVGTPPPNKDTGENPFSFDFTPVREVPKKE